MTSIGLSVGRTAYRSREAQIEIKFEGAGGRHTREEVEARVDRSAALNLKMAETKKRLVAGEGTYVGHSINGRVAWKPNLAAQQIESLRAGRIEHYANMPGPVEIHALDVNSAVKAQATLKGADLVSLSTYGRYLQNEVAAAKATRPDVSFTGGWADRVTHDVNEYIGWITDAMKQSAASQA